jgi:hypothetical protein
MKEVRKMEEPKIYAKEKLEEALYFLLQMRRYYVDRKEFIYNMNAFLNSARNVTFALQKEFSHDPYFEAWYSKKQKEMREDKLMKYFIDMRNVSVKEATPEHSLSLKVAYVIPDERKEAIGYVERRISGDERDSDSILILPTRDKTGMHTKPKIVKPTYSLVTFWEFEKAPEGYEGKDILVLCVTYYHKLEQLIAEAERTIRSAAFDRRE